MFLFIVYLLENTAILHTNDEIDYESISLYSFEIEVTDGDFNVKQDCTVTIIDINEPPELTDESPTVFIVTENVPAGTRARPLGSSAPAPLLARDPEGHKFRFDIIGGNIDNAFRIDNSEDALGFIIVNTPIIDYENILIYHLHIRITDIFPEDPQSSEYNITVHVENVNDIFVADFEGDIPLATQGGTIITLVGTDFGPLGRKIDATYRRPNQPKSSAYIAKDCKVVIRNVKITCETAAGVGGNLIWDLLFLNPEEDHIPVKRISYKAPVITDVIGSSTMETIGGQPITIRGENFGPSSQVFDVVASYGINGNEFGTSCTVVNQGEVRCVSAAGVGSNLRFLLRIANQQSSLYHSNIGYAPPVVDSVTNGFLLRTQGGEEIDVHGSNFGPFGSEIIVSYGPSSNTQKYKAASCAFEQAHTLLKCISVAGGGADLIWSVTVGGQTSSILPRPEVQTSFVPPQIFDVYGPGSNRATTAGGEQIVVQGINFGPSSDPIPIITYGRKGTEFTAQECEMSTEQLVLVCLTAPGTGKDHSWIVDVAGQKTPIFVANTSYAPPIIQGFREDGAEDASTHGGEVVVIVGSNFGTVAANAITRVTYGEIGFEFAASGCFVLVNHVRVSIQIAITLCVIVPFALYVLNCHDSHKFFN